MNYSIEAQAEALYLFNMNANLEYQSYVVNKKLWQLYEKSKSLNKDKEFTFRFLITLYNDLKKEYVEYNEAVILCYVRNILLYKFTTLYQDLLNDNELLENLK